MIKQSYLTVFRSLFHYNNNDNDNDDDDDYGQLQHITDYTINTIYVCMYICMYVCAYSMYILELTYENMIKQNYLTVFLLGLFQYNNNDNDDDEYSSLHYY